jgi:hypothetical protein
VQQISAPDPVTVKIPELALALPARTGLPMSRAVHGDGTVAVGVAATAGVEKVAVAA